MVAMEAVMVVAEKEGEEMVMEGMVAAAKVEVEMAAVEKVAAGMEEEMAEATEVDQEVAPVGGKEAVGTVEVEKAEVTEGEATAAGAMVVVGKARHLVRHLRSSMR